MADAVRAAFERWYGGAAVEGLSRGDVNWDRRFRAMTVRPANDEDRQRQSNDQGA